MTMQSSDFNSEYNVHNFFSDNYPSIGRMELDMEHWWYFVDVVSRSDKGEIISYHPCGPVMEVLVAFASDDILEAMGAKHYR